MCHLRHNSTRYSSPNPTRAPVSLRNLSAISLQSLRSAPQKPALLLFGRLGNSILGTSRPSSHSTVSCCRVMNLAVKFIFFIVAILAVLGAIEGFSGRNKHLVSSYDALPPHLTTRPSATHSKSLQASSSQRYHATNTPSNTGNQVRGRSDGAEALPGHHKGTGSSMPSKPSRHSSYAYHPPPPPPPPSHSTHAYLFSIKCRLSNTSNLASLDIRPTIFGPKNLEIIGTPPHTRQPLSSAPLASPSRCFFSSRPSTLPRLLSLSCPDFDEASLEECHYHGDSATVAERRASGNILINMAINASTTNTSFSDEFCSLIGGGTLNIIVTSTGGHQLVPSCLTGATSATGIAFTGLLVQDFSYFPSTMTSFTCSQCFFEAPSMFSVLKKEAQEGSLVSINLKSNAELSKHGQQGQDEAHIKNGHRMTGKALSSGFYSDGTIAWADLWSNFPSLRNFNAIDTSMTGTLPSSIPSHIIEFQASGSQLTGSIPYTIFHDFINTTTLENFVFDISSNQLTGSVSDALFTPFSSVSFNNAIDGTGIRIDISNNLLSGSISPDLLTPFTETRANMLIFSASLNQLDGTIPATLFPPNIISPSATQAVVTLDLANNFLTGNLPRQLMNGFPSLLSLTLDLSNNQLSGTLPSPLLSSSWVASNYSTFSVMLKNNSFTGSIPAGFVSSQYSETTTFGSFFLELNNNNLTGTIPWDLLVSPSGSTISADTPVVIDLSSNRLEGEIPSSLFSILPSGDSPSTTYYFSVANNRLNGTIPSTLLTASRPATTTSTILLTNNTLSGSLPDSCYSLPYYWFDASLNQISGTIPGPWQGCYFTKLGLAWNLNFGGEISPSIMGRGQLLNLNLSHTNMTGQLIDGLPTSLTTIDLSYSMMNFCADENTPISQSFASYNGICNLNFTDACHCPSAYPRCDTSCVFLDETCSPSTRPSPQFICVGGVWTAPAVTTPTLTIPAGSGEVKIIGNVSSTSIVLNSLGSTIYIDGCASNLSAILIELEKEEAENIGKTTLNQTLIVLSNFGSTCTDLSGVAISSSVKSGGCKKVKVKKTVSSDRTTLAGLFTLDSSGCNRWWIILVSVIAAIVILAVIAIIVIVSCWSRIREKNFMKRLGGSSEK